MYRIATLIVGSLLVAFSASAQVPDPAQMGGEEATFDGLGDLPGGGVDSSKARAVSADGSVVVGFGISDNGTEAFRWTEAKGMVGLGGFSEANFHSQANAVSADGSVVVGLSNPEIGTEAFRWEDGEMEGLGFLFEPASTSLAFGASADGSVVVGWSVTATGPVAFRWEDDVMVGLGDLPGGGSTSEGYGVSADGAVVVGQGSADTGQEAFRWQDDTMVGLGSLPGGPPSSFARGVSTNGAAVVGYGGSANGNEAFRWTQTGGMVGLGDLVGGSFASQALAASADGSTIVGWGTTDDGEEAFIWTEEEGMRNLKEVLETDYELNLTGWTLVRAEGISSTGNVIVGYGVNPEGDTEAWRADLSPGGNPSIEVHPVALDFGNVSEGGVEMRSITILNDGDDVLEVTDISSDNPVFTSSFSSPFTVIEGDSASVSVTFSPEGLGVESGVLTIESNASEMATVSLEGEGVPPPAIVVTPDSLSQEVQIGSTEVVSEAITIANNGEGSLAFTAAFVQDTDPNVVFTPEQVAAQSSAGEVTPEQSQAWRVSESSEGSGTAGGESGFNDSIYQVDDGSSEAALGLNGGGDVMWLNAFEVVDGFNTITEVSTTWGCTGCDGLPPSGSPATILVYDDPNDDGNPGDAVLLSTTETQIDRPGTNDFTTTAIEATPVSGVFFIAVLYRHQAASETPIPLDGNSTYQGASWIVAHTVPGEFDEENLAGNSNPPIQVHNTGFLANAMVRADASSNVIAVSPASGDVLPGEMLTLDAHFDGTTLELGTYTGDLVISSNDPESPEVGVEARMDVIAAPYPFVLSPEELNIEINLAEGDSTTTAPVTITNSTGEEQFFLVEARGVSGNASLQQADVTAYGSRRGEVGPDFVSFSLNAPDEFTSIGPSPLVFGADFLAGDDETLYVITGPPDHTFFAVDVETGEMTQIASIPPPADFIWAGLVGDPTDGTLYISSPDFLYVIDPETGELDEVGQYDGDYNMLAIAIDGDGQMYGHNNATNPASSRLVAIDKQSAEVQDIGPTGFSTTFVQGMDFDLETGRLYMSACENLPEGEGGCVAEFRSVNTETGATTVLETWGPDFLIDGLAFTNTPFLFIDAPLRSGTLVSGGEITIDAQIDARPLGVGTYFASLVVISDEPGRPEEIIPVTLEVVNTIADEASPEEIAEGLSRPRPNPVRTTTTFTVAVKEAQDLNVEVFDITGRRVQILYEGRLAAETSETLTFDASALPAGVYVVRVVGEDFTRARRVTIVR